MTSKVNLASMYSARRKKLLEQINEGIVLINIANSAPDPLLFDKNLEYLAGRLPKDSVLLLAPNGLIIDTFETLHGPELGRGRKVQEILFTRELSAREKFIDGDDKSTSDISENTGLEVIKPVSELDRTISGNIMRENMIWANIPYNPNFSKPVPEDMIRLNQIRKRCPWIQVKNIAPMIHKMRWVKDDYEIDCLRNAYRIHADIFSKIMKSLKPGDNEFKGKAIYDHEVGLQDPLTTRGDWDDRYESNIIVASGNRTLIGHYMDNNQVIQDGDLVLIDGGVEYLGYSSDITRTFPANGVFSDRQRELYEIVLEALKRAIATMKPGNTQIDSHQAAYDYLAEHDLAQYGYGRAGHPVGLNIHDPSDLRGGDTLPYQHGVVLAIEPFITLKDEGIGIRIEDGVLITDNGPEVLAGPPKEIKEIETLCKRN